MKAIGPIVGFVMRETKGRADGGEVTRLIREKLGLVALVTSVTRASSGMAWNVVIAGGGFAGRRPPASSSGCCRSSRRA